MEWQAVPGEHRHDVDAQRLPLLVPPGRGARHPATAGPSRPAPVRGRYGRGAVLFPPNLTYLQARFPWLTIGEVLADAGACEQTCLDAIWNAGALRMVDVCAHQSDDDPDIRLTRGYDEHGHPLCPLGYVLHANGYDYRRRRAKWRCARRCQHDPNRPVPPCDYLKAKYKHGYPTTVGRTHADGSVRLARETPYGSPAWKARYGRRNSAESRNSVLERWGLKRMPVHGLASCHVTVLQGDFVANQCTLVRLIREATALG